MIKKISDYIEGVKELRAKVDNEPWFRGINNHELSVSPGLYWRDIECEWDLASSFLAQAPQFLHANQQIFYQEELAAPWERYFLMQHYGLPTRLIDWTENPLTALYFAVREFEQNKIPCVWVLNPYAMNKKTIDSEEIIVPGRDFSQHWLFPVSSEDEKRCKCGQQIKFLYGGKEYENDGPIAIYPVRSNPRILAQQGVFTVHGANTRGLDAILGTCVFDQNTPLSSDILIKIQIDPSAVEAILRESSKITSTIME